MNNSHNQKSEESLPLTKLGTMEDMEDEGTRFAMEAEEPLLSDDSIRNVLIHLNQMTLAEFLGCSIDDTNQVQVFDEYMASSQANTIVEPRNNLTLIVIKAAIELFPDEGDNDSNYELFNCNNFSIRYWSWNYRGCWHQTCPPIDPR